MSDNMSLALCVVITLAALSISLALGGIASAILKLAKKDKNE